eukprot:3886610-Karenia_brevis.AAC.1
MSMVFQGLPLVPQDDVKAEPLKRSHPADEIRSLPQVPQEVGVGPQLHSVLPVVPIYPKSCNRKNKSPRLSGAKRTHGGDQRASTSRHIQCSPQPWILPSGISQDAHVLAWLSSSAPRWVDVVCRLLSHRIECIVPRVMFDCDGICAPGEAMRFL